MKIFGLTILLAVFIAIPSTAQVTWGMRGGLAYSSLIQKTDNNYRSGARFGFSAAGLVQIPLYKHLSLQPEVAFVHQGGNFRSDIANAEGYDIVYPKTKCNYYSILVPVNLMYTFRFTDVYLSVMAGPALDFSLFGKMRTGDMKSDIVFGKSDKADFYTFNMGVNLGFQVEYAKFFFVVSALCGTLDRRTSKYDGESSIYQNNVNFSFGYYFRK